MTANRYLSDWSRSKWRSISSGISCVCKYAASLYDEVIADCLAWEKQFPKDPMLAENLALLGDAYGATDKIQEAIEAGKSNR